MVFKASSSLSTTSNKVLGQTIEALHAGMLQTRSGTPKEGFLTRLKLLGSIIVIKDKVLIKDH